MLRILDLDRSYRPGAGSLVPLLFKSGRRVVVVELSPTTRRHCILKAKALSSDNHNSKHYNTNYLIAIASTPFMGPLTFLNFGGWGSFRPKFIYCISSVLFCLQADSPGVRVCGGPAKACDS